MNDSIERIKEDAIKLVSEYWNCTKVYSCIDCPSKIDGKIPSEHYGTNNCLEAMNIELIERTVKVMESSIERTCYTDERRTTRNGKFKTKYGNRVPLCEHCGYSIGDKRYNFCPNCGAKVVE